MSFIKSSVKKFLALREESRKKRRLKSYLEKRVPWSEGYEDFKWNEISNSITNESILAAFRNKVDIPGYGVGMDERLVEYPFVFSRLKKGNSVILDAGSTFNFETIVSHPAISEKELCIYTYFPENWNFISRRISYEFGDLRNLPFRDSWFDEVVCISTLEHIGLDNSIYGYGEKEDMIRGTDSYTIAIEEMIRVLKPGGQLLLTFPFGKNINYGFFQQFDSQMLGIILGIMKSKGDATCTFFQYLINGWIYSTEEKCRESLSYNPHTGEGKDDDGAAHSRAICAIQFIKRSS